MNRKEAEEILGTQPIEQKKTNKEIDLFAKAVKSNLSQSGFNTITIKGYGVFNIPEKYLVGNTAYKDAKTSKIAVANGILDDGKTLRFDRSSNPCEVVETNEGNQVSLKLDTLSMNLKRHSQKMPNGL